MLSARRWVDTISLLLCSSCIVESNISADFSAHHHLERSLLVEGIGQEEDVSECILLFGAYCNGNMGDVIQASTLSRLVSSVSPEASCVWHAHPSKEALANGFHEGEFFAKNSAGVVGLGCDRKSGEQVSRFKGFVIGGGGLFESRHWPLDCEEFVEGLREDIPVAIFGVGASVQANLSAPIIRRANYVSGRDQKSVKAFSDLLSTLTNAKTTPEEVARVRDPVLSDGYFKDVSGRCWRQSQGDPSEKPLCFALPSALTEELQLLHRVYSSEIVREGDVLLNVFPKHQAEIEEYPYPAPVEAVLDPAQFASRLCACRAVITSRLHGTIIGLHSGVPTIAAWPTGEGNKVPDLMKDVLRFPDQFLLVEASLTREALNERVDMIRASYAAGRRERLFVKLDFIARHTQEQSLHMLKDVFGLDMHGGLGSVDDATAGLFWKEPGHTPLLGGQLADDVQAAESETVRVSQDPVKKRPSANQDKAGKKGPRGQGGVGPVERRPVAEADRKEGGGGEGSVLAGSTSEQQGRSYSSLKNRSPWERWGGAWGMGKTEGEAHKLSPGVGGEVPFAGGFYLSLVALLMIALLGLPALSSLAAVEAPSPLGQGGGVAVGAITVDKVPDFLEGGLPSAADAAPVAVVPPCRPLIGERRLRAADMAFFGVNYILWVALSVGFNVCCKTYMRETRNPMALLAIQGWVGIAILCSMNIIARYRQRGELSHALPCSPRPASPPTFSCSSPLPAPAWAGKCGPRQLRRVGRSVWQAGLLHSSNAVLTNWSVLVGGVAATHALKALEPVAAAGFSRWLLGSTLPPRRVAAVAIIVLGLSILMVPFHLPRWARGSEGAVAVMGGQDLTIPAVVTAFACCAVALRNVLLKRPNPPPPPPLLGLLVCSVVGAALGSLALLVPFLPSSWEWSGESVVRASGFNAALCSVGYNLASFNLLSELSPVGHAVGNASKRVILFASGLFLMGEEESVSPRQLAGASVAFLGLASYNIAGASARSAALPSR